MYTKLPCATELQPNDVQRDAEPEYTNHTTSRSAWIIQSDRSLNSTVNARILMAPSPLAMNTPGQRLALIFQTEKAAGTAGDPVLDAPRFSSVIFFRSPGGSAR